MCYQLFDNSIVILIIDSKNVKCKEIINNPEVLPPAKFPVIMLFQKM